MNCSQQGNTTIRISRTLGIFITDVNEAPFNLTITNDAVEENLEQIPSFVAAISAKDYDGDVSIPNIVNNYRPI